MIDVKEIVTAAREGINIDARITEVPHPDNTDDTGPAVPVVLVSERDESGNVTTCVQLAADVLAELDRRMPGPLRREGRVHLHDVASFCEYLSRYQAPDRSVVYANIQAMTFEAVLDEHPIQLPDDKLATAWRGHRAIYACPRSPEWIAWTKCDGVEMKQEAFADFLEARLEDLSAVQGFPKPNEVLQVARQLHIRTKGEFRREFNPTTGDHILVNKTETDTGSTQIPRAFMVVIPVFEGGARYQVEARVRMTVGEAGARFSYNLHRRAEIERDAFNTVRAEIGATAKLPVLSGVPG